MELSDFIIVTASFFLSWAIIVAIHYENAQVLIEDEMQPEDKPTMYVTSVGDFVDLQHTH